MMASDTHKRINDIQSIEDDTLPEVSGGDSGPAAGKFIISEKEAQRADEQALLDGRAINLPSGIV